MIKLIPNFVIIKVVKHKGFVYLDNKSKREEFDKELSKLLDDYYLRNKRNTVKKIFKLFEPRIYTLAKQYKSPTVELEDFIQEGNIGLIQAIRKFDRNKGIPFAAYSKIWLIAGMRRLVYKNLSPVKIPEGKVKLAIKLKKIITKSPNLTIPELAEIMNVKISDVQICFKIIPYFENISLDDYIYSGDEVATLHEIITDPTSDPERKLDNSLLLKYMHRDIEDAIKTGKLNERNYEIYKQAIGYDSAPVQKVDIAKNFNLSIATIQDIIRSTALKLEYLLEPYSSQVY